jgi:hypothetical protein
LPAGRKIPMMDDKSEEHNTPWLRPLIAAVFFVLVSLIPGWVKKRYGAVAGSGPVSRR